MQARNITLVEIGAGALPAVTPVDRRRSSWFPMVYVSPDVPPLEGVTPTPVADGVLIEWEAVDQEGVIYVIERGPTETGPWTEIHRTTDTRYLYSDGSGQAWYFRITATVRGKPGPAEVVLGTPELVATQNALDQERAERLQGDLQSVATASADATAKANAALAEAIARVDALAGEIGEIVNAPEWSATEDYIAGWLVREGGNLYRARVASTGLQPSTSPAAWEYIGQFASAAEAAAAALQLATATASELEAEALRISSMQARMPAGSGQLETKARVDQVDQARATGDLALGQRVDAVQVQLGDKADAGALLLLEGRVGDVEAQSAATLRAVSAVANPAPNMLMNSTFREGTAAWTGSTGIVFPAYEQRYGYYGSVNAVPGGRSIDQLVAVGTDARTYTLSADFYRAGSGGVARIELNAFNAASQNVGSVTALTDPSTAHAWQRPTCTLAAPAGTNRVEARIIFENTTEGCSFRRAKLEAGAVATAWSDEITSANTAQGLIDVRTRTTALEAEANVASSAIAQLGGSGNLFENSDFARTGALNSAEGWGWAWNPGGWGHPWPPQIAPAGAGWEPAGGRSIGANIVGTPGPGDYGVVYQGGIQAEPNKRYIVSAFTAQHRCKTALGIRFLDANGNNVRENTSDWSTIAGNGGAQLSNWEYRWFSLVAPATAASVDAGVWVTGTNEANPYFWFTRPQLEQASENQLKPTPWSPNGSSKQSAAAFSTISASVDAVSGRVAAQITNVTDVNGNISGTVSENDGVRSSFSILATVFRVISTLTGMGMEWLDGYLRIWRGSAQLVLGHSFGSGDLVMWYGPNVGAANCTRSNGLFHLDTSGGGYFGGSLSAGVLKNAVQTTNTATSGVELINGPFGTNGNVRNVVVSYSRTHRRVKNAAGTDGFVAWAGSNSAIVQVYRKIGDAAEALWQTINVSGHVDIRNEPDSADVAISTWGGAVTVNDTSPAASVVQYRAVLTGFTAQAVTHQSGSFDSQTITQNLSIVSVEN